MGLHVCVLYKKGNLEAGGKDKNWVVIDILRKIYMIIYKGDKGNKANLGK